MPWYKQKITSSMDYQTFKTAIQELSIQRQAFLTILFFAGVRISEALALTSDNINCEEETVYIDFHRLKGSAQTDPIPMPRIDALEWVCTQRGDLFPFCRKTGYNIVKRTFSRLYPHYFRQNRFTNIAEKFPLATLINFSGLTPNAVKFYIAKVDIKKVGKALKDEIG